MDLTLPKIQPNKLTSSNANETDKARYEQAYAEFSNLNQGYSDLAIQTGDSVEIIDQSQIGKRSRKKEPEILPTYIQGSRVMTPAELIVSGSATTADAEQMETIARNAMPEYRRSQSVMDEYRKVQSGDIDYDTFLLNAYGRDVLKANNYHTDSIVWWKSQFRQGNYQHPLDNVATRSAVIKQAEELFQLEGFYNSLLSNNTSNLESLVGKVLNEDGYKSVFGEAWEDIVEKLGSFETAVSYYKAGYLGDALNQLIYTDYKNDGTPVGDPAYYVGTDGKLYELVDKSKRIDKSYQMYLEKNPDGTIDRVTQAANGLGEFWGSFGNGFIGAFTGVVDLVSMVGLSWASSFNSLFGDGDLEVHEFFTHLLLPGIDQLWVKDEWYAKNFAKYQGWMNNNMNQAMLRQQDFDSNKWDHWQSFVGSALGMITETTLEIFLSSVTAGGYSAIKRGAQGASAMGKSAIKGALKEFGEQVATNLGKSAAKTIAKDGAEKVVREVVEDIAKNGSKELVEKLGKETTEKIIKDSLELIAKENLDDIAVDFIEKTINDVTGRIIGQEIIESSILRGAGRTIKKTTNGLLKASNHLKMLNSGSAPFLNRTFQRLVGPKWGSTMARATVNFYMTAAETAVKQRTRQLYDTELTDDLIIRNSLVSAAIVAASTLGLSSSTDDLDNMKRFQGDRKDAITAAISDLTKQGKKLSEITKDMINDQLAASAKAGTLKTVASLQKFDIGKFMLGYNTKRIVGGASEFFDNIITTSVRNAASVGVKNLWGDDGLIDLGGALTSPDILVSTALSTTMSVVGRRGWGFAENEGSFNQGVASTKKEIREIYGRFEGILDTLYQYADGDTKLAIEEMTLSMRNTFKESLKNNSGDDIEPYLVVLQKITNEAGTDATGNPLLGLDNVVNTILKTKAGQDAIANDALKIYGINKKTTSVSMSDIVGSVFDKTKIQENLRFYKSITDMYYLRKQHKAELLSATGNKGREILKGKLGRGLKKTLGYFFNADKITDIADQKNHFSQAHSYIMKIAPDLLLSGELSQLSIDSLLSIALDSSIENLEIKIQDTEYGKNFDTHIDTYRKTMTFDEVIYEQVTQYKELQRLLISSGFATDEADAELKMNQTLRSRKNNEDLTAEQKNVFEMIKSFAEKKNILNAKTKRLLGLSNVEIDQIRKNAARGANGADVEEITRSHIKNGVVVNFFANDMPGDDDADALAYRKAIVKALKLIEKASHDGGDSPHTFVVLDEKAGKVFIASPIEIDNFIRVNETLGVLDKIVRSMNVLNSKVATIEEKEIALQLMSKTLQINPKTYKNVDDLMKDLNEKVTDYSSTIATMDILANPSIGALSMSDVLKIVKANSELTKAVKNLSNSKSLSYKALKLEESMGSARKLLLAKGSSETKMLQLFKDLEYIRKNKKSMDAEFSQLIGYDEKTFENVFNVLKEFAANNSNFKQTQEKLDALMTKLSTQYERDSSQQARMNLIRQWGNLTGEDKVVEKLNEILNEDSSSSSVLAKLITSSLGSPFEEGKTLKSILELAKSAGLMEIADDYDDIEEYVSLKYLDATREKRDNLVSTIVKKVRGIKSATHLESELRNPNTKFKFDKVQHLIEESTKLTKAISEIRTRQMFDDSPERRTELESRYKKIELKNLADKKLAEVILDAAIKKDLNLNQNVVDEFLKNHGLLIEDISIKEHIKHGFTNKKLEGFIPSLNGYLKNKTYETFHEAVADVRNAYNNMQIYSKLEEKISSYMEQTDNLYAKSIPLASDVKKITVNIGELSTIAISKFSKNVRTLSNQKDGDLSQYDFETAVTKTYGLSRSLKMLRDLQKTFRYNPVMTFDLDDDTHAPEFYSLMKTLGYSKDDVYHASAGKVHKIPGVYFNNDSSVIASGTSKAKYNSFQDLIRKEINNISFELVNAVDNSYLVKRETIKSLFPRGISGLTGDTPLNVGGSFQPNWSFSTSETVLTSVAVNYIEAIKAGKAASAGKDAAFGILYNTIGMKFENPREFSNYLLIKGIIDTVNIDKEKYSESNALHWSVSKFSDAKITALKNAGWEINEKEKFITHLDKDKFNAYIKARKGIINLNEILPVDDNYRYTENSGGGSFEDFSKRYYEELGVLYGDDNHTDGVIKILVPDKDEPFTIPKGITINDAISKYEKSSNLQERTFAIALKASLAAVDKYDEYLDKYNFSKEDKDRLKLIGQLINDDKVVEILASNDSNESKADKIKLYLFKKLDSDDEIKSILNSDDSLDDKTKKIKLRLKTKRANGENISVNELDVSTKNGRIALNESVIYSNALDYSNPELFDIDSDSIELLNKFSTSTYVNEVSETYDTVYHDLKNRFISMLSYDETEGFTVSVANLSKLKTSDFAEIIDGNDLTLGSWIEETFGKDFYDDIKYTTEIYDQLYPNYRGEKFRPQQIKQLINDMTTPNKRTNAETGIDQSTVEEQAKNKAINRMRTEEKNIMDNDTIKLSELESSTLDSIKPFFENRNKELNKTLLRSNATTGRLQYDNLKNKVSLTNYLDNLEAVRQELESGNIIKGFKIEDGKQLAFDIVSLSSMNSGNDMKNSYIFLTVKKGTNEFSYEVVTTSKHHPFNDLAIKMAKNLNSPDDHYLIRIEDSFSLKTPNDKNYSLSVTNLKGYNESSSTSTTRDFFKSLFFNYYNNLSEKGISADEINKQLMEAVYNDSRISFDKNLIIEELQTKFNDLSADVLSNVVSLFRTRLSEIQSDSASQILNMQALHSVFDAPGQNSIFNEKTKNLFVSRVQGVLFDNLDMTNLPKQIEGALDIAYDSIIASVKNKGDDYYEEMMQTVNKIMLGEVGAYRRYNPAIEGNMEKIADIIKLFAVETKNTAFKKMILESMIPQTAGNNNSTGKELNDYRLERLRDIEVSKVNKVKTLKNELSLDFLMKSNEVNRIFIDNEWTFDNNEKNKFIFEFGYYKSNGKRENILIKPPEHIRKMILENIDGGNHKEWSKFTQWLHDNKKIKAFQDACKDGLDLENDKEATINLIKGIIEDKNDNTLYITHNGKAAGADLEVMTSCFGEDISKIINKSGYGHLDVLNDILRSKFILQRPDQQTKFALNSWGKLIYGISFEESHDAMEDAELLFKVSNVVGEYIISTVTAKTKVLDYTAEIFEKITGAKLYSDLNDDLNGYVNLTNLSRMLRNENQPKLDEETKIKLEQWSRDASTITDELTSKVTARLSHIESLREIQSMKSSMFDYVDSHNRFDSKKLRTFFNGNSNQETKSMVKHSLNMIYEIISNPIDDKPVKHDMTEVTKTISKAIGRLYNEKEGSDYYSDDAFISFINDLKNDSNATINKIVKEYGLLSVGDHKYIDANDHASLKETLVKHTKDVYSSMLDEIDMTNFQKEFAQNVFYKKLTDVFNDLIFKNVKDTELQRSLINKVLRMVGATDEYKTPEEAQAEFDKMATSATFKSNFFKKLQENNFRSFKESVTNEGFYKMVKAILPETVSRLGLTNDGIGCIVANAAGVKQYLGTSLAQYKEDHNIGKDEPVYISVLRHPSDKLNTLHAYKLVEDTGDTETAAKFSMNALELYSKHSGDFDGDHITIFVPDDFQQKLYSTVLDEDNKTMLDLLNEPYIKLQKYLKAVYSDDAVSKMFKEKISKDLNETISIQQEISQIFYNQTDAVKKLIESLNDSDDSYYNELVTKITNDINDGRSDDDLVTEDFIRENFIKKDKYKSVYIVNNKYMLESGKDYTKLKTSLAQKNTILESSINASFKQSIDLKDQVTGMLEKDMINTLQATKDKQYIAIKLSGRDFDAIDEFLQTEHGRRLTQEMYGDGTGSEFEGNAFTVYRGILAQQYNQRESDTFNSSLEKFFLKASDKTESEYSSIEKMVSKINKMHQAYKSLLPDGYTESKFANSNYIPYEQKIMLLKMFQESDEMRKSSLIEERLAESDFVQRGLAKEVYSLVDIEGTDLGENEDTVRLTRDFINNNKIYRTHEHDFENPKPRKDFTKNGKLIKKIKVGSREIEVYEQEINSNIKLANVSAGTFGKVTVSGTPFESDEYKGYAYVMSKSSLEKLNKAKSPNVELVREDGKLKEVTIEGKKYWVVKSEIAIAEDEDVWRQDVSNSFFDELSFIMNANTVEFIPLASGLVLQVKDGDISFDTSMLRDIYEYRQKARNKNFYSPDFMSTYNQLRAITAIEYGLSNIKDPKVLDSLRKQKERYSLPNKNYSNNLTDVDDIIRTVEINTDNKFLSSLSGVQERLFSEALLKMAIQNTINIFDFSKLEELGYDLNGVNINDYMFAGKGSRENAIASKYPHQPKGVTYEGPLMDEAKRGSLNGQLYLPTYDAVNYLLGPEKRIYKDDLLRANIHELINMGKVGKKGIGLLYSGYDMNNFTGSEVEVPTEARLINKKGGYNSADGVHRKHTDEGGSSFGVNQEVDDKDVYYGTSDAYDKYIRTVHMKDGLIDKDTPYLKSYNGKDGHTNRHQKFLKHLEALLDDDMNVNDRISNFKNNLIEKINVFTNGIRFDLINGNITPIYVTNPGKTLLSFKEALKHIYNSQNYDAFGEIRQFKDDQIEKLSKGLLTKADLESFKTKQEENKKLPDLSDYKFNKSLFDAEGRFQEKATVSKFTGNPINDDSKDTRLYFRQLNDGSTEINHSSYDALDEVGIKATDIKGVDVKQGIGKFYRDSKYYLHQITSPLDQIKTIIGDNSHALREFGRFTEVRRLALAYKEATNLKDFDTLNLIKKTMSTLGVSSFEDANAQMKTYSKMNPGLTSLYYRTVQNLIDAANDIADTTGGRANVNELFLLSPSVKKNKNSAENKNRYYNALNTVFLHEKKELSFMVEMATEYNFAEAVFELGSRISKVKAMKDSMAYFKKSGSTENQSIYELTHNEFENGIESIKKPLTYTEKQARRQMIEALGSTTNGLDEHMATDDNFYSEVYWQLKNSYTTFIDSSGYGDEYKTKSLYDLKQEYDIEQDDSKKVFLNTLIEEQQAQRIFMADTIALNDDLAKKIYSKIEALASVKNSVLTNEFMQMLPGEGGRSSFNCLHSFDFNSLRSSVDYIQGGNNDTQRRIYMALSGNLFLSNKDLATHMDKYFFTEKLPNKVEELLSSAKGNFAKFIMSMPHKLVGRMVQYSIGDLALISTTDPSVVKNIPNALSELQQFYSSKGASLKEGSELEIFFKSIGFNPMSYNSKSLNLDTFEHENNKYLGQGYFNLVENAFTVQTLMGRYALWQSLYHRFKTYDETGVDKRLYGPLYSQKQFIDAMESPEAKAREIVYATIGGPNGFALIARKELNNIGMFMTYPLALLRTGIGHLKSFGSVVNEVLDGSLSSSGKRWLGSTAAGIAGTHLITSAIIGLISNYFGVDEETEEEWKKKSTYINPLLSILNDRPIAMQGGSVGLYSQLREMFYEPFEEADNLMEGGVNWFSANVTSRLNPLFKMPLELFSGKDYYGSEGAQDTQARSFSDNLSRKLLSTFIGASGASAMSEQWYYSSLGEEDPNFINKLGLSMKAAIKAEMGNYRGYKTLQKNYFDALTMVRGFKNLETSDNIFSYSDNGYDSEQMYDLSSKIKRALDKEQPASVIYGFIDEAIKEGASSSTIKAAIYNNSISGKLSQLENPEMFYSTLDAKSEDVLEDALKYEEQHYSILKTLISEYANAKSGYTPKAYVNKAYYTYPSYSSSKYNNHYQYNNSWFSDDKWTDYAKKYIEYRAKNNFVPSLTELTGKYKKKQPKIYTPKKKNIKGELDTYRFYDEDDNALSTRSRVNEEDR